MSSLVKAIILRQMKDREVLLQTLDEMCVRFTNVTNQLLLENEIILEKQGKNLIAKYRTTNQVANQFLQDLIHLYVKNFQIKIERLRQQEAELAEQKTLKQIEEEQFKEKTLQLKRERLRLERLKRQEDQQLQKEIDQKAKIIKERAEKLGYVIQEEIREKKRVLVLVRRL